ncbi:putative nicotinic acid transporter [Encephalitozoon romaleae SJ-2008]|uniref:Nicotinic acid transporter n=1 Tax=Encephalitozoon romaleae (strain SJ-2008) TaxID=1178016 RepID=I7ANW1_ENCRO|nr:putative nicotinic acid transporter [Encephalitozoon romaleae SJ-2008]AFN83479.1 putative nicotinic acid transporter [Encephalitozoon romaleae SJ-2008]
MWSKKKLEAFVILNIVAAVILSVLKVVVLVNYKAGGLLMLVSSFAKMMISYLNIQSFDFKMKYAFIIAGLSFIGGYLGMVSYYYKASSISYVISSDLQYLFTALIATAWNGTRYSSTQCVGILMILGGFFIEISSGERFSIPFHMLIGTLSGLFNSISLAIFESKIKPALVDFRRFWCYMTTYTFFLTFFSLFYAAEEVFSKKSNYVKIISSPIIYIVFLIEVLTTYLLSEISLFLDTVERSTLLNVVTGISAVVSDVYLSREIDVQRFLAFSFTAIGVQIFNFFWKEAVHPFGQACTT